MDHHAQVYLGGEMLLAFKISTTVLLTISQVMELLSCFGKIFGSTERYWLTSLTAYYFALDQDATVQEFLATANLHSLLALPLSVQAYEESLTFIHALDQDFLVDRFYRILFERVPSDLALRSIWKSNCLINMKVVTPPEHEGYDAPLTVAA